jgi:hypothetical protein
VRHATSVLTSIGQIPRRIRSFSASDSLWQAERFLLARSLEDSEIPTQSLIGTPRLPNEKSILGIAANRAKSKPIVPQKWNIVKTCFFVAHGSSWASKSGHQNPLMPFTGAIPIRKIMFENLQLREFELRH